MSELYMWDLEVMLEPIWFVLPIWRCFMFNMFYSVEPWFPSRHCETPHGATPAGRYPPWRIKHYAIINLLGNYTIKKNSSPQKLCKIWILIKIYTFPKIKRKFILLQWVYFCTLIYNKKVSISDNKLANKSSLSLVSNSLVSSKSS